MEDPDDEDKVPLSTVEDWIVDQLAKRLPIDDLFNLQMKRVYEIQSNANLEVKLRRKPTAKTANRKPRKCSKCGKSGHTKSSCTSKSKGKRKTNYIKIQSLQVLVIVVVMTLIQILVKLVTRIVTHTCVTV